ncbi:hypothetical protein ASF48_05095 [Rathayibacter sp. Leaf299]|uniref:HNH endonuclease n=1 Tax=Rathayibacter sp. Leaf299 TaxID=1736328 RepID=UPI0006FFC927|nr:hypothetical protein [Rathayibacter sp. Leaf299]KQQ22562.1 hypothetical protein ASF48_05095 [Rathayibacter sp. Leaf299]
MSKGVSPTVRARVRSRDADCCQWCGRQVDVEYEHYSLQHRRARQSGGTRRPEANAEGNLVFVCGSATTGCHQHIESHSEEAQARGFDLFFACPTPSDVPIQVEDPTVGRVWVRLIDGSEGKAFVPEREAVAVMVAAGYIREEMAS